MSLYNERLNNQLIDCCATLSSETLNKDTNSFFSSVISYWNHILFGDLILLNRLAETELTNLKTKTLSNFPTPKTTKDIYQSEFSKFIPLRQQLDQLIIVFCTNLTEDECKKVFSYRTTEGQLVNKVVSDVIQHIFNHQTHHRGQLTCVLSQLGVDYGCTDLPIIVPEGSVT